MAHPEIAGVTCTKPEDRCFVKHSAMHFPDGVEAVPLTWDNPRQIPPRKPKEGKTKEMATPKPGSGGTAGPPSDVFKRPEALPLKPLSNPDEDRVGGMHGDPQRTEEAEAYAVLPRSGYQRREVLDAIAASGDYGLTDDDAKLQTGVVRAAARRHELMQGGWVEDSGRVRPTSDGGTGIVWVITTHGKIALRSE